MKYQIFLGKGGKSTGPFTDEEVTALKADGKIAEYHWIWDTRSPGWQPLDPPPPPPAGVQLPAQAPVAAPPPYPAPGMAVRPVQEIPDPTFIEAVCYDFRNVVNGRICRVSDYGCVLVGHDVGHGPSFGSNARVYLNLLDTDAGRSMSVMGHLQEVSREDGEWRYHIRWNQCPEILR